MCSNILTGLSQSFRQMLAKAKHDLTFAHLSMHADDDDVAGVRLSSLLTYVLGI